MNTIQNNAEPASAPPGYIKSLYRFSLLCGASSLALSLVAGVATATIAASLDDSLVALWMVVWGLLTLIGGGALAWVLLADSRYRRLPRRAAWRAALLLLAPVAVYAVENMAQPDTFTIVVHNDTTGVLHSALIDGACCVTRLGDIAPHHARTATLRIDNDGGFSLDYSRNGRRHSVQIDGYLGIGEYGRQDITVKADGTVDGLR